MTDLPAVPRGANMEDCPRCNDPNPNYPWVCPGHPAEPAAAAPPCLFCAVDDPAANRIMLANVTCFVRYDNHPATPGHVEIAPKRHVESFFDLTPAEAADAHALLLAARQTLDAQYRPDGYTIGINDGRAAGRTVDHVHIHLIPRHHGDVPDPRGGIRRGLPNGDPDQWAGPVACSGTDGLCAVHGFHRHPPGPAGLRERLDAALTPWLYEDTVDRVMTVISPELARRDEELLRLRAEAATADRIRADVQRDRDELLAELTRLHNADSADAAAGSYAHRAERAEAELARLREESPWLKATAEDLAAARAANERVRRLCELTIAVSVRAHAIEQALDTLDALTPQETL